jgi:hypothetical protein
MRYHRLRRAVANALKVVMVEPYRTGRPLGKNCEADRELCSIAARLLMALAPGQEREDAAERLMQRYRDDLAAAHPGVDPAVLDNMTLNFGGALLLEMERVGLAYTTDGDMGARLTSGGGGGPFRSDQGFNFDCQCRYHGWLERQHQLAIFGC